MFDLKIKAEAIVTNALVSRSYWPPQWQDGLQ